MTAVASKSFNCIPFIRIPGCEEWILHLILFLEDSKTATFDFKFMARGSDDLLSNFGIALYVFSTQIILTLVPVTLHSTIVRLAN